MEEKQIFASTALSTKAAYQQAMANLDKARVNLERTRIVLATTSMSGSGVSLVNAVSFWVDGCFEETSLGSIREGDPASIKVIGYSQILRGHVDSVARGIDVTNASPDASGLAAVNPIFTWVRLAQRVPVRVHIDEVPEGVRLVADMTATVQIDPRPR
jgi:multidrug resistance efflux pump